MTATRQEIDPAKVLLVRELRDPLPESALDRIPQEEWLGLMVHRLGHIPALRGLAETMKSRNGGPRTSFNTMADAVRCRALLSARTQLISRDEQWLVADAAPAVVARLNAFPIQLRAYMTETGDNKVVDCDARGLVGDVPPERAWANFPGVNQVKIEAIDRDEEETYKSLFLNNASGLDRRGQAGKAGQINSLLVYEGAVIATANTPNQLKVSIANAVTRYSGEVIRTAGRGRPKPP